MNPNFSEFSYGYAVTEELVTAMKAAVVAAPVFPSLYEEGKKGGYDVKIPLMGKPVFLQFKLSEYLERTNAKEHRDGVLTVPYYRMHLRPTRHSDQHNLLLDLEASGETVLYIAPEFHLPTELNIYYLNKSVLTNSAAFSPQGIGPLPDDDAHYIVFKRGSSHAFMCSDKPVEIVKTSLKEGLAPLLSEREIQARELGEDGLRSIVETMLKVLEQGEMRLRYQKKSVDIDGIRRITSNRSPVESIGYMARTFFDAELLIIPS